MEVKVENETATARSPRYRVNLKETAKGIITVDCTAECGEPGEAVSKALTLLSETRRHLVEAGRQVAE